MLVDAQLAPRLLFPYEGQIGAELRYANSVWLILVPDRFRDLRSERSKPQVAPYVRAVNAVVRWQAFEARVFAGLELLLPAICFGERGDGRAIVFAFLRGLAVVAARGDHQLAAVATVGTNADPDDRVVAEYSLR